MRKWNYIFFGVVLILTAFFVGLWAGSELFSSITSASLTHLPKGIFFSIATVASLYLGIHLIRKGQDKDSA